MPATPGWSVSALRVLRKDEVHAVSDVIAEIVAYVAYSIQPRERGAAAVSGQCNGNGKGRNSLDLDLGYYRSIPSLVASRVSLLP